MKNFKLSLNQVYKACPVETFNTPKKNVNQIEQKRALNSIEMGVHITAPGYNIFAMGKSGIGRKRLILDFLNKTAQKHPVPKDWIYVHNFDQEEVPNAIALRPGEAKIFKKYIDRMINDLGIIIPSIFEGESYRGKILEITKSLEEKQQKLFDKIYNEALENKLLITRNQNGFSIIATGEDNKPISEDSFSQLTIEQKEKIAVNIKFFQQKLEKALSSIPLNEKEKQTKIAAHNQKVIEKTIKPFISKVMRKWSDTKEIPQYLKQLSEYISEHYHVFLSKSNLDSQQEAIQSMIKEKHMNVFKVNIIVDKRKEKGAPVIYLDNPNYGKLFGKIEYSTNMGVLSTDFTNIKSGYLHQANGGYLVINARKLLEIPVLWESLKQVLKDKKIYFLTPENTMYNTNLITLDPEPIPLDVKIILVGEPSIYYALWQHDSEFKDLFKIVADFDSSIPYNDDNILTYYSYIQSVIKENKLKNFSDKAIAKTIEKAAILANSQELLSTDVSKLQSILIEANYIAKKKKLNTVTESEIIESYRRQRERSGKFSEHMEKTINQKVILVETTGEQVGQINGLAVFSINDFMFGQPQRISSNVYRGKTGVVNIEKVVSLSGAIHHKGVMILQSFLNSKLSKKSPLAFSASIVFEQSYGTIDGDSATSTEFYALLSALSELPIKQGIAVTGSMDQKGRIQAIGGVNHKIEGFFNICKHNGLTGENGVIIPQSNIKDLMVNEEVKSAIANNLFSIYAISHADEGIEILTGVKAGDPNKEGQYPSNTVYGKIQKKWTDQICASSNDITKNNQ